MSEHVTPLKVFVTSAYSDAEPISTFRTRVEQDRFKVHQSVNSPEDADIILFVENSQYHNDVNFRELARHQLVRQFREKVFMYNEHDRPWCVLPGVYQGLDDRTVDMNRQRATSFVQRINPFISLAESDKEPEFLFTFTGAATTAPVRADLLKLSHPRASITDSRRTFNAYSSQDGNQDKDGRQRSYAAELKRSKFVLCPRGVATSSYRMFETMESGRVPVVISDHYVFPIGPDWTRISIQIPESDVASIPQILEAREHESREMGLAARAAWEEWFAPEVFFHRVVNSCADILENRRRPESVSQRLPQRAYIEWRARAVVRPVRDKLRSVLTR